MALQIDPPVATGVSRREFLINAGLSVAFVGTTTIQAAAGPLQGANGTGNDLAKITKLLAGGEPAVWLFTGDSITHGAKHTHGYRCYPQIFEERIRWELKRFRDVVLNTGVSGNTTISLLDDFDWRIAHFKPSVVSVMIGTNDCAKEDITMEVFAENLLRLVVQIRQLNAVAVLHTPNIIITERSPERAGLERYVAVIRKVAEENEMILADNYAHWQEAFAKSDEVNVFRDWLNDPLHPNGTGHQQIARQLFKTIGIFDPKEATCGGAYYEGEH